MASVKVAVRVRPFNKRELAMNAKLIVQMDGKKTRICSSSKNTVNCWEIDKEKYKDFTFDHSYWSFDANDENYADQDEVFHDLGTDVIESAFAGYNACVFAYGQTGSGKTFTMMGSPESQGLIPRICKTLFSRMAAGKETGTSYRTEVSFLEIHNERVRDLLRPDQAKLHSLKVREHPKRGPYVQDLSSHLVYDYADIQECMIRGNTHRTTASTNMNDVSSRSHAIFTITFVQAGFSEGNMPSETVSKVHLVDLAGSERANSTGATGQRLKEGAHINKSLVTLGSVISALAEVSSTSLSSSSSSSCDFNTNNSSLYLKKSVFIPYRDSVLTWLLKDSLGGNSKTIMIAAISPADCNYSETLSTLRYANRAKNIINKPTINEDPNVKLIKELREEILKLKSIMSKEISTSTSTVAPPPSISIEKQQQQQPSLLPPTTPPPPPPQKILLAQIHEKQEQEKVLTEEWTEKWRETQKILKEQRALGLRKSGIGVVLDSEMPHLVGIDDDLLSTGVTLYHLKEGKTHVGTEEANTIQDIVLTGPDVEPKHCIVELCCGVAILDPLSVNCWINMIQIDKPTRLSQGCIIVLGKNNMFRYNDPVEAAKLRKGGGGGVGISTGNTFANSGNLQSTVVNLSRLSLLSWSVSDLNVSSSSENLINSNEDIQAIEELEQQKAALIKEKQDFKKEQEEREERWTARREALEGAQKQLEKEWGTQWKEWADAIGALESRQHEIHTRRRKLEQERRDEMTQTNDEATANNVSQGFWCSSNNSKSIDTTMQELIENHKKELATLECELENKVETLSQHQRRVIKMEQELADLSDKQKNMMMANIAFENDGIAEKKLLLAGQTPEQLQEIIKKKQSFSLNLRRALPASPNKSSTSSSCSANELLSTHDLKSFQDACNEKVKIASALSLFTPDDVPSSSDTSETFHTAAAADDYSPEQQPAVDEITLDKNTSTKLIKYSINNNIIKENDFNNDDDDDDDDGMPENNPAMKKLNNKICQQRGLVMKCLEKNSPANKDLNHEILILQDLQRQQIELEIWLLKQEKQKIISSSSELVINYSETEESEDENNGQWNKKRLSSSSSSSSSLRHSPIVINNNDNKLIKKKTTTTTTTNEISTSSVDLTTVEKTIPSVVNRGYSSVYLTSINRATTAASASAAGDRATLGNPFSLSLTRSLPSLIANDNCNNSLTIINMIISVPSYVIRGAGTSSHYEYEVRVIVKDDSWTLLRRYRRFRELYMSMKQKYGSKVSAIRFPPRQVFSRYEMVARQRRKRLEEYLRNLIQVCSELENCQSLYKHRNNLSSIDKQSLVEFNCFFRRGTFESSKYGTS
ncbi:kinesin-like protein KIF16B isoform X2 [Aphidius gifuensis]|uniref:kinesin-like protein KIF16B isoform X2 n=1 Tax=Aphidius gifuensis TaxID=684658 RepID=UPI001CDD654C|nr:kinesin-like protein KIF16B isoform X2 [Aphidius gifuensis]